MRDSYPDLGYFTLYGMFCKESNQLVYVGVTKTLVKRRLNRHSKWDRNKYYCNSLMFFATREVAEEWETYFINRFNLVEVGLNEATGPGTTGVVQNEEWKRKKVESRAWYTEHSTETILKMREAKKAKMHPILCHQNGKEYESIASACRELGLHSSKVSQVVRGHRKSTKGYTFERLKD